MGTTIGTPASDALDMPTTPLGSACLFVKSALGRRAINRISSQYRFLGTLRRKARRHSRLARAADADRVVRPSLGRVSPFPTLFRVGSVEGARSVRRLLCLIPNRPPFLRRSRWVGGLGEWSVGVLLPTSLARLGVRFDPSG